MKYIRTKDGIYESDKTIFGKHTKIVIYNKKTNEVITEMICDCIEEKSIIEDMLFAEYCKTHKLNPLDYRRKTVAINPLVIAQADTIEELCDEFVHIDKGCYPEISDELDLMQTKSTIIYGAIWTKGEHDEPILKSVAKMNSKGELELI